jgi:adenosylcobyric acid synthase
MIINKFCGDPSLLGSGVDQLEKLTGVPVMGIVPHSGLRIPSEDSVSIDDKKPRGALDLDVAIVRFPLISNFTDFEALERIARVRYVPLDGSLGRPDVIILPGSKNTVSDLKALTSSRLFDEIRMLAGEGIPVVGICGGYQMLGRQVIDSGIENGTAETLEGLNLLPAVTVFDRYEKCTRQCTKTVTGDGPLLGSIKGLTVSGYEIHMGQSEASSPAFGDDGCVSGTVIGTYLHGIFENPAFTDAILRYACERKGIAYARPESLIDPYDELADLVAASVDLDAIVRLI